MIHIQFQKENLIKSPLNYTGGKFKLLEQILPIFPDKIDRFIDLFCGGCNVGINVQANKIICNDNMKPLINMYKEFQKYTFDELLEYIENKIKEYNMSKTNKEGYLEFRKHYNETKYPIDLYILTCYSFNNSIRFNSKDEFNVPYGNRQFSENMKNNIKDFLRIVQKIKFSCCDFTTLPFEKLTSNDMVYCDPPYLITVANYNENGGWTENHELDLYELLDKLNENKVKFALSNVFTHKGKVNNTLIEWSKKYNVHYLNATYKNCNYQTHYLPDTSSTEVLITNY